MLWGRDAAAFTQAKASFAQQKVTYLLSFNEPDVSAAPSECRELVGLTARWTDCDRIRRLRYLCGRRRHASQGLL